MHGVKCPKCGKVTIGVPTWMLALWKCDCHKKEGQ